MYASASLWVSVFVYMSVRACVATDMRGEELICQSECVWCARQCVR